MSVLEDSTTRRDSRQGGENRQRRRQSRHRGISLASAFVILAALIPVSFGTFSSTPAVAANAKPVEGGSVTFAFDEDEDTLNPAVSPEDVTALIDRNIFDSLVVQTGPDTFGPWLATSWTVSPNGLTYTFKLRSGVKFQDGTPFNAEAVKKTLDYIVAPSTKSEYAVFLIAAYKSSTVLNNLEIQINLKTPFNSLLQALSTAYLSIQSPTELAKPAADYIPVGTGPYKYKAWNKGLNVILTKVPTYTSPPSNATHSGPAYISTLTFQFISEDATRYGALTSGELQGIEDVPPLDVKTLEGTPGFYVTTDKEPGEDYALYFNTSVAPFSNLDIRKAFVEAADIPQLVKTIYFGRYPAGVNPLGPTTQYFSSAATPLAYNVSGAEKLLAEAGYTTKNSAGYLTKDGKVLTVSWPYSATANREERNIVGQGIVQEEKTIGIDVVRPAVDSTQYDTDLFSGKYDIADFSFLRDSAAVLDDFFNSKETLANGGANVGHVDVPQLDTWLNGAEESTNPATIKSDYAKVQEYVLQNALVLPVYDPVYELGATTKLQGLRFDAQAFPLFYGAWLS
jgi:peptide/nickel transport system substrate-binding protein